MLKKASSLHPPYARRPPGPRLPRHALCSSDALLPELRSRSFGRFTDSLVRLAPERPAASLTTLLEHPENHRL